MSAKAAHAIDRVIVTRPEPEAARWVESLRERGWAAEAWPLLRIFRSGFTMYMWAVPRLAVSTSGSRSLASLCSADARPSGLRVNSAAPASARNSR